MTLIKWRFVAKRTSYMRYFDTRTYFVARTNDYREINDRLVCEQVSWLGFGVCFGGGATSASWQEEWGVGEASLHAHGLFFFFFNFAS